MLKGILFLIFIPRRRRESGSRLYKQGVRLFSRLCMSSFSVFLLLVRGYPETVYGLGRLFSVMEFVLGHRAQAMKH